METQIVIKGTGCELTYCQTSACQEAIAIYTGLHDESFTKSLRVIHETDQSITYRGMGHHRYCTVEIDKTGNAGCDVVQ